MHADHAVDDEFETGEADTAVRNACEVEGLVRVADVHHDFDRDIGQRIQFDARLLEVEAAFVDDTLVAFGAADGDVLSVRDPLRGVATADDGRDPEFASDDRRVAGTSTAVRNNCRSAFHDRLPVRVGHVRDEDVALLDAIHFADIANDLGGTCADLLADASAAANHVRGFFQREALYRATRAALHGLWSCLQYVELAVIAVLAPFDVHRATVVFLDRDGHLCEFDDIVVGVRECMRVCLVDIDGFDGPAGRRIVRVDHLDGFAAEVFAQNRKTAIPERRFVDVELVRIDGTLHDGLAESVGRGYEYCVAKAGFGIECEYDARGTHVASHHRLYTGRECDLAVIEALMDAISDGAVIEQRCEHHVYRRNHVLEAAYVEKGLLLACK